LQTPHFNIGNIVEVPFLNMPATIEELTWFFVVLRNFDNQRILINNYSFLASAVPVYEQIHRYELILPVSYDSDLEWIQNQVKKALCGSSLAKLLNCEGVIVKVASFDASTIRIEIGVPVYRYLLVKFNEPLLIFLAKLNKILYEKVLKPLNPKAFNWLTFTLD